ncbi:DUF6168 family protein [Ulvibacter antarcticus]|uniref:ATP synthase protein I n=1 Tax=Ulvibacter antarcticus TaxID=442714 RepID=A0A3L9YZ84_9FLAO|nr:DUF6168 family protein [Ulvibacter antarcticus]RMA65956.1 hypothetical protein BXY75_0372 [Ulvibacter antarcticus]
MKKQRNAFIILLFLVIVLVFGVHLFILWTLELNLLDNRILLSYVLNYALAVIVLLVIQSHLNKQSLNTGFIFMAGSGVKFLIFFLIFYPFYQKDEIMQTAEFAAFFTPYAVCLILEVIYLSKLLNNQTYSEDKASEKKK